MTSTTVWWTELTSITLHVEGDAPRLWPESASEEYRRARMALAAAEAELRDRIEAVAAAGGGCGSCRAPARAS